jgi:hypothetical protein
MKQANFTLTVQIQKPADQQPTLTKAQRLWLWVKAFAWMAVGLCCKLLALKSVFACLLWCFVWIDGPEDLARAFLRTALDGVFAWCFICSSDAAECRVTETLSRLR